MARRSIYQFCTVVLAAIFLLAQIGFAAHAAEIGDDAQHSDCAVCYIVSEDYDGDDFTSLLETSVFGPIIYETNESSLLAEDISQTHINIKRARAPPKSLV